MSDEYSPEKLGGLDDALEDEGQFTGRRVSDRSVKLDQDGEQWLIRFLPAQLGPRKLFWARIAQHWINQRPHFCAKETPVEFGGVEGSSCELCDVAEKYREDKVKAAGSIAYKAGASFQWLTYTLVWSKKIPGQKLWQPDDDEKWHTYKFWLNKTNFEEVREYFLRYREKKPNMPLSILDWENGFDFYVKKTDRKLVLQKDDPRAVFDGSLSKEAEDEVYYNIMDQMKTPTYRELTQDEMEAAADKLEEAISRARSDRRSKSDSDGDNMDLPARGGDRSKNSSRGESRDASSDRSSRPTERSSERRTDRGGEQSERTPDRSDRQERPRSERSPDRSSDSGRSERQERPTQQSRSERPRSVPESQGNDRSSRSLPSAARSRKPDDDDDLNYGSSPTQTQPAETPSSRLRQAARPAETQKSEGHQGTGESSVDDDDNVTSETHDHIPPTDVTGIAQDDDAPPAPVTSVQQTPPRMSERLRSAIRKV